MTSQYLGQPLGLPATATTSTSSSTSNNNRSITDNNNSMQASGLEYQSVLAQAKPAIISGEPASQHQMQQSKKRNNPSEQNELNSLKLQQQQQSNLDSNRLKTSEMIFTNLKLANESTPNAYMSTSARNQHQRVMQSTRNQSNSQLIDDDDKLHKQNVSNEMRQAAVLASQQQHQQQVRLSATQRLAMTAKRNSQQHHHHQQQQQQQQSIVTSTNSTQNSNRQTPKTQCLETLLALQRQLQQHAHQNLQQATCNNSDNKNGFQEQISDAASMANLQLPPRLKTIADEEDAREIIYDKELPPLPTRSGLSDDDDGSSSSFNSSDNNSSSASSSGDSSQLNSLDSHQSSPATSLVSLPPPPPPISHYLEQYDDSVKGTDLQAASIAQQTLTSTPGTKQRYSPKLSLTPPDAFRSGTGASSTRAAPEPPSSSDQQFVATLIEGMSKVRMQPKPSTQTSQISISNSSQVQQQHQQYNRLDGMALPPPPPPLPTNFGEPLKGELPRDEQPTFRFPTPPPLEMLLGAGDALSNAFDVVDSGPMTMTTQGKHNFNLISENDKENTISTRSRQVNKQPDDMISCATDQFQQDRLAMAQFAVVSPNAIAEQITTSEDDDDDEEDEDDDDDDEDDDDDFQCKIPAHSQERAQSLTQFTSQFSSSSFTASMAAPLASQMAPLTTGHQRLLSVNCSTPPPTQTSPLINNATAKAAAPAATTPVRQQQQQITSAASANHQAGQRFNGHHSFSLAQHRGHVPSSSSPSSTASSSSNSDTSSDNNSSGSSSTSGFHSSIESPSLPPSNTQQHHQVQLQIQVQQQQQQRSPLQSTQSMLASMIVRRGKETMQQQQNHRVVTSLSSPAIGQQSRQEGTAGSGQNNNINYKQQQRNGGQFDQQTSVPLPMLPPPPPTPTIPAQTTNKQQQLHNTNSGVAPTSGNLKPKPALKHKKSVSFSDKVELVACAEDIQMDEHLPNPLLARVLASSSHKVTN